MARSHVVGDWSSQTRCLCSIVTREDIFGWMSHIKLIIKRNHKTVREPLWNSVRSQTSIQSQWRNIQHVENVLIWETCPRFSFKFIYNTIRGIFRRRVTGTIISWSFSIISNRYQPSYQGTTATNGIKSSLFVFIQLIFFETYHVTIVKMRSKHPWWSEITNKL